MPGAGLVHSISIHHDEVQKQGAIIKKATQI
jgi:hypothetical protein